MPRKGVPKVRTGCLTSNTNTHRKRKVKCDETRPSCNRCTSTGRTCDGYMPPPPGWMSWDRLLSPSVPSSPDPLPDADSLELRSLAFYRQIVAPTLCGPLDSSFWTKLVAQMVHSEPATRHAVLAISSLYENFDDTALQLHRSNRQAGTDTVDDFAIQHYNAAISHLISPQTSCPADINTVLLVCILFTCIEFLRGDTESAISHSQHGISLLNSGTDVKPELVRVFRHLSIFPYFFGGEISTFPVLNDAQTVADTFDTLDEALESLDWLLARAVRLVRASDFHRLGIGEESQPLEAVLHEQLTLEIDLDAWWTTFSSIRSGNNSEQAMTLLILEMRWLVCKIWANTCLASHETIYDEHLDKFTRIVEMATQAQTLMESVGDSIHHKFMFVMGFCPLLYFVVIKCRVLRLRLGALSLLKALSYIRETLWDASTLYAVGRRIVELEHGMGEGEAAESVPDEVRVRDSAVEAGDDGRRLCLLVLGGDGIERVYVDLM
ncbi:C6 zinc finger domain-containing protein [Pochonia chlamydosporia 170]|uniref:C6 zinc finger domain-containing protein n=1 Tax=Pochonia chlamydosporia 170 TaxID=1380566 RepID=A0A179F2K1_METCM|nr:C6 zinc finger domain-containing protein [Pochonia chlamydosporia 170]OAQ59611.1 C6 zinc finger domain-containing protein [Pochonia chlamydosporia 170]